MSEPTLTPGEVRQIQRRYEQLKKELLSLGWICQGSLMHTPPHAWRWTRKVNAKTVTVALSEPQAELYRQAIANHRRLEQVLSEMRDLSQTDLEQLAGWQFCRIRSQSGFASDWRVRNSKM
jgi:hypothetical protein